MSYIHVKVPLHPLATKGGWNDAPERTHAEVLALYDKAIATERGKA